MPTLAGRASRESHLPLELPEPVASRFQGPFVYAARVSHRVSSTPIVLFSCERWRFSSGSGLLMGRAVPNIRSAVR